MIDFNEVLAKNPNSPPTRKVLDQEHQRLILLVTEMEHKKKKTYNLLMIVISFLFITTGIYLHFGWLMVALSLSFFVPLALAILIFIHAEEKEEKVGVVIPIMTATGFLSYISINAMGGFQPETIGIISLIFAITVGIIGRIGCIRYIKKIQNPLKTANTALANLEELDVMNSPDKYIEMNKWSEKSEIINAYLSALKTLGRFPVMGEYWAMEDWMQTGHKESEELKCAQKIAEKFTSKTS